MANKSASPPTQPSSTWRKIWIGATGVVLGSAAWWIILALGAHISLHIH